MRELALDQGFAQRKTGLHLTSRTWKSTPEDPQEGNRVTDSQIYDAALNKFARLSMSAALASPTMK